MSPSSSAHLPVRTQTALRRALSAASVALLAGAGILGVSTAAHAHDQLVGTAIVEDATSGVAQAFELTFSNSIMEVGTEIYVTGPDGADATDGAPEVEGPAVTQPLAADLAPGEYAAGWRVVSSDGHPIEGSFGIAVAANGAAELIAAPADQDAAAENEQGNTEGTDTGSAAADPSESESDGSGLPVGGVIAIVVGGVAVAAGGVTAAIAANRRRAQGMAGDAATGSDA